MKFLADVEHKVIHERDCQETTDLVALAPMDEAEVTHKLDSGEYGRCKTCNVEAWWRATEHSREVARLGARFEARQGLSA